MLHLNMNSLINDRQVLNIYYASKEKTVLIFLMNVTEMLILIEKIIKKDMPKSGIIILIQNIQLQMMLIMKKAAARQLKKAAICG